MRTMTDILTRMFHTNQDRADPEASQAAPLSSQVGNLSVERVSESDEDNGTIYIKSIIVIIFATTSYIIISKCLVCYLQGECLKNQYYNYIMFK